MRKAVDDLGQTIVMVTHDPIAAGYADRVVFLADGAIVDELLAADGRLGARQDEEPGRLTAMWKVTLKGIWAKKVRFLLTGIAVMLGVAFISGTFVLTATISNTFDGLFNDIYENTDAVVRAKEAFSGDFGGGPRDASAPTCCRRSAARDGVAAADGTVQGLAVIVDKKGDALGSNGQGAPTLGFAWIRDRDLSTLHLVAGRGARARPTRSSSTRRAPTTPATSPATPCR